MCEIRANGHSFGAKSVFWFIMAQLDMI